MISLIALGAEFSLDDGTYCFFLGDAGLGMIPIHRFSERGPLQDGDTDLGYRGDPRFFSLFLEIVGISRNDLWDKRQTLLRMFRPRSSPISIKWVLSSTYQIDCHYASDLVMPSTDREGFSQRVVVTLKANDPTLYDPVADAVTFQLGAGSDSFPVPMSVPHNVGVSTINLSIAIVYQGTADSYPTLIRLTGPLVDPVITNLLTGEKLDFTGTTISGSTYYDIDLRYGYKTVKDNTGVNQISKLTNDSDLATFHLESAEDGSLSLENPIRVQATGATPTSKVEITYFKRLIGI